MNTAKSMQLASAIAIGMGMVTASATAQLYSQNFETDSTATWTMLSGPSDSSADYFFNYSTVGIPAAPSGAGTRGMKLQANLFNGVFSGMNVVPTGQSFTGDYIVRFDWWANSIGPFPLGGSGSTNVSTFGIGTSGLSVQWPGAAAAINSVFFGAVNDGNSAFDYRAYSSAANSGYLAGSSVFAAQGAANNSNFHPYYSIFGNVTAPAAQTAMFPQQTGAIQVGAAGMAWHRVRIRKSGNTLTWTVDGLLIATIDLSTVTLGGSNILFGHSDVNAGSSLDPNGHQLLFTLIDNIAVTRPADIVPGGQVNVDDLLAVINQWGACPVPPGACDADIAPAPNGDGVVNVDDLLLVINNWG